MSERYSKIFTLSNDLYVKDCPVLIRAGALLKDNVTNNVLAQIKFENISPKIIIALKIKFIAKDIAGRDLEEEFQGQYLDLRVCRGDDFGAKTPIILTKDVRNIVPVVTEVVFSGDSLWQGEAKFISSLPSQGLLANKLSEYGLWQYNEMFYNTHKFLLSECDNIWLCACGAINHKDETICYNCQCSYQSLKDINFSSLEKDGRYNKACDNMRYNTIESHQEAIELLEQIPDWHDSKEKIAKCSEKIEQFKAEEAAENKKRKITLAVLAVFAVICVVIGIVVKTIYKSNKYDAAMVLYNDCKYDKAYDVFSALNGFKDSEDYAQKLSLLLSEEGDVFTLGNYEWVVIECDSTNNKVLILSTESVTTSNLSKNGWADSEIREWLNNDFYSDLTEDGFKGIKILETELPDVHTTDKIFLLSIKEVKNSRYAVIRDGWTRSIEVKTVTGYTYYYADGEPTINTDEKEIYPAMWVTIEK